MSDFNEIINSEKPTLVDFYATWCGPCKMMNPIMEETKTEIGDTANILKVDVDKNREVAVKYGIRGVPTMIIFQNGQPVWRQSGVIPKSTLVENINKFLS